MRWQSATAADAAAQRFSLVGIAFQVKNFFLTLYGMAAADRLCLLDHRGLSDGAWRRPARDIATQLAAQTVYGSAKMCSNWAASGSLEGHGHQPGRHDD